jgi:hypothetical protein
LVGRETAFESKGGVEVDRTEDVHALAELCAAYSKHGKVAERRGRSFGVDAEVRALNLRATPDAPHALLSRRDPRECPPECSE